MMNKGSKYNICVLGSEKDWWFNGNFIEDNGKYFTFYDERDDKDVLVMWDKLIWVKDLEGGQN